MGSDAVDGLRNFMLNTYGRVNWGHMDQKTVEAGSGHDSGTNTGMTFHGVQIHWDPTFADLGSTWEKRMYFINSKHLKLRPLSGHDMITRKPPRAYDKYQYYWGLTWRGAMCTMSFVRGRARGAPPLNGLYILIGVYRRKSNVQNTKSKNFNCKRHDNKAGY